MSREGEARRPALLEPPKRSPRSSLLPTASRPCCLSAVCRSAATASPPVRAADAHSTACQGRAGGRADEWGRARLGLDRLCYTWTAARRQCRKKRVKGLDFGLYIIRDFADRGEFGLVLLGMPGLERRLMRAPQLYSRVGFAHEMEPLSDDETRDFLEKRWSHRVKAYSDDFTDKEAVAAILRITRGNIRLIERLMLQVEHVLVANQIQVVTKEVVETARQNLIIGPD